MKKNTTTHIDTGSHGYYSVSKKDIEYLGISDKISGFSGHTLNRVYLEEDCDAMLLYNRAEEMGVEVIRKCGIKEVISSCFDARHTIRLYNIPPAKYINLINQIQLKN